MPLDLFYKLEILLQHKLSHRCDCTRPKLVIVQAVVAREPSFLQLQRTHIRNVARSFKIIKRYTCIELNAILGGARL
jgi:hypothetical protein